MNCTTKDGWTPAMIAAIYKCDSALDMFFKYGGIELNAKDNAGLTIEGLAKKYGATACAEKYRTVLKKYPSGYIPPTGL